MPLARTPIIISPLSNALCRYWGYVSRTVEINRLSSNSGFVPERASCGGSHNVGEVPAAAIWLAAVNTVLGLPIDAQRALRWTVALI